MELTLQTPALLFPAVSLTAPLETIGDAAVKAGVKAPAVLVVGEIVRRRTDPFATVTPGSEGATADRADRAAVPS